MQTFSVFPSMIWYNKYIIYTKKAQLRASFVAVCRLYQKTSVRTKDVENKLLATCLKVGLFVITHFANSLSSAL